MSIATAISETKVPLPYDAIGVLCRRFGVAELAVFGSVLRDDFRPDSDIDFLVSFIGNDFGPWGSNVTGLAEALENLLERHVDVVTRSAVEKSENYIRRCHILESARTIYGS